MKIVWACAMDANKCPFRRSKRVVSQWSNKTKGRPKGTWMEAIRKDMVV